MRVALVVAGGRGTRLGGVDKPALVVRGRSLLDRAIDAVPGMPVVVVGPRRPTARPVGWAREDPVGSGPVAAVRAGLDALRLVDHDTVVLLAADLPDITRATVDDLVAAAGETGAVLVDADGREQWLLSAWPFAVLRRVVPERAADLGLRQVLAGQRPVLVPDRHGAAGDIDTPEDLGRHRAGGGPG